MRYVFGQWLEELYLSELTVSQNVWVWLRCKLVQHHQPIVSEGFEMLSLQRDFLKMVDVVHQLCVLA